MVEHLLQLFRDYPNMAFIISIGLSIIIAMAGVVPSVFITAANILFFGFWNGMFISFLGEAVGAGIAFLSYRAGFKKAVIKNLERYPKAKRLLEAGDKDAFYLVIALRLIPFVPSGLITFAAAVGRIGFLVFMVASSLGKIPALFIEAWAVKAVTDFTWPGKLVLTGTALFLLYWVFSKKEKH